MPIKYKKFFSLFIISAICCLCFVNVLYAQNTVLDGTDEPCNCSGSDKNLERCKQYCGEYKLDDFVNLLIKISQILLGITGSLALLALVYGGVIFIISAGNREMIEKAKKIIIGSVIGLAVVFLSWAIAGLIFEILGIEDDWFRADWFRNRS